MGHTSRIPAERSQILEAFTDAQIASEALRDTFTRMGWTQLASVAERNIASIRSARETFLSIVEPRELRRPVTVTEPGEALEPQGVSGE